MLFLRTFINVFVLVDERLAKITESNKKPKNQKQILWSDIKNKYRIHNNSHQGFFTAHGITITCIMWTFERKAPIKPVF